MRDSGQYDLNLRRGRGFRFVFTMKENGEALNLVDHSFRMMIKTDASNQGPWRGCEFSTSNGHITANEQGRVTIVIPLSVTLALPSMPQQGVYDILMVAPGAEARTIMEGSVFLKDSVTPP